GEADDGGYQEAEWAGVVGAPAVSAVPRHGAYSHRRGSAAGSGHRNDVREVRVDDRGTDDCGEAQADRR
ncbi:hypothetical protein QNA19_24605, partial [Rhodococcus fascians]|uniref:hypothetical protein n=1 Tax=Rhodococcoides fascians TaxID=1828 RepID=UPI0024BA616B